MNSNRILGLILVQFNGVLRKVMNTYGTPEMRTSESGALPGASGDQLEGASGDLRARRSDADDARHAPTLVGRLQGLTLKDGISFSYEWL